MSGVTARDLSHRLAKTPFRQRKKIVNAMDPVVLAKFDAEFESWAHDNQLPPSGEGWTTWLMMAGRGFGKTRAGAEWVDAMARSRPGMFIALIGATIQDARAIMVEGVSGVLAVARNKGLRVNWEPSIGRLRWPNGSQAKLFSGDSPDGLRGPEHDIAWADELAKWSHPDETWANLEMGLRRGPRPRVLVTTTPKPLPLLNRLRARERTFETNGRTHDNINLEKSFVELMEATYGGTRFGRQELDGELFSDFEGALWTREMIEASRSEPPAMCDRIYVGVDPPAAAGEAADACGIAVVGRAGGVLHLLADETVQGLRPEGWASAVARAAARWGTNLVVAEANNGGAMVESVLKAADSGLQVRLVHAAAGKSARAEPIALKFEKGTAKLAGEFPELEAQLAGMIAGGGYEGPGRSPDRADAMVWAMAALGESRSGVPRVRRL